MKPRAWLYEWDNGSDVWQDQPEGEVLFDLVPNPHTCTALYTADQLRAAKVAVLRDLIRRSEACNSAQGVAIEAGRMADEIEKGERE